jgi:hypothetical protein
MVWCNRSDSRRLFDKTSLGADLSFRVADFSVQEKICHERRGPRRSLEAAIARKN